MDCSFCLVGITWTAAKRKELETESPFLLQDCQLNLEFNFKDPSEIFPHSNNLGNFAEFGVFNQPNSLFQTEFLSMKFDSVDFNWFGKPQSEKVCLI